MKQYPITPFQDSLKLNIPPNKSALIYTPAKNRAKPELLVVVIQKAYYNENAVHMVDKTITESMEVYSECQVHFVFRYYDLFSCDKISG